MGINRNLEGQKGKKKEGEGGRVEICSGSSFLSAQFS